VIPIYVSSRTIKATEFITIDYGETFHAKDGLKTWLELSTPWNTCLCGAVNCPHREKRNAIYNMFYK